MQHFITSYLSFFMVGIAVIFCFFALKRLLKHRKERQAQKDMALLQRRNEALNETLSNPKAKRNDKTMAGPMEIQWDERALDNKRANGPAMMIELVEFSTYSRRKYLFPISQHISIGSGSGNQLILQREGVLPKHCELFLTDNAVAVRSVSGSKTLLIRGKTSTFISDEGVFLNNGDHIRIGTADVQYRCFEA